MDAGEYDTNTLLISKISSIAFQVYEPVISHTFAASDVESALRRDGHLVYVDSVRRAVWCFHLVRKDMATVNQTSAPNVVSNIDPSGWKLKLVEEGGFEPISLSKSRIPGSNPLNTPNYGSASSTVDAPARTAQSSVLSSTNFSAATSFEPEGKDGKDSSSPIAGSRGYASIPVKEMYDFFITSVLSSLSSALCAKLGAIALNRRLLLLPAKVRDVEENDIALRPSTTSIAAFRVYLTTTGSLVISLCLSVVGGMISVADARLAMVAPGSPVFTAPMGTFAALQGLIDGESDTFDPGYGPSPGTQMTRFRPDSEERIVHWRGVCKKVLEMSGVPASVLEGSSWLSLQLSMRKTLEQQSDGKRTPALMPSQNILWPSTLCFRKSHKLLPSISPPSDRTVPYQNEKFDPLSEARTWFQKNGEREDALTRRKTERETAAVRETVDSDGRLVNQNGYSPSALRQPANPGAPAAAGSMYPTPPDGVQNPIGVTPTFDGNVSSPTTQANAAALVDIDTAMTSASLDEAFAESWEASDVKRERPNHTLIEGENLFGDIGEDIFGDTDITDADFNFFDEQPDEVDLDMSDLPDIGTSLDNSNSVDHAPHQTPRAEAMPDAKKLGENSFPPIFAKPELKHARSSLNDGNQHSLELDGPGGRPHSTRIKRPASPFDPHSVYKKVRGSVNAAAAAHNTPEGVRERSRRPSDFDKVQLGPSMSLVNKKYQDSGRFDCHWAAQKENKPHTSTPTTLDHLRSRGMDGKLKVLPSSMGSLIAKITGGLENSSLQSSSPKIGDVSSDTDSVSLVSDQDDDNFTAEEPISPTKSVMTRRRPDDDGLSIAPSQRELESAAVESPIHVVSELVKFPNNDTQRLSIVKFFAEPDPIPANLAFSDDDFIAIAQTLTEQAATSAFIANAQNFESGAQLNSETRRRLANDVRLSVQVLKSVLPSSLKDAVEGQLKPLVEIQDVPLPGQPNRMQPRPVAGPHGTEQARPSLFPIPPPHVELRRYDTKLSVLPSAVSFWESLGLGPSQGPKDVNALCIFPNWEGMSDNASNLLDRLRSVYESLKLGSFDRIPSGSFTDGLIPFGSDKVFSASPGIPASPISSLGEKMDKLASVLTSYKLADKNFVIYFIYSRDDPNSIIAACGAFTRLSETYRKILSSRKSSPLNELVLQLIPLDYVASPTSLTILSPPEYVRLCLETYDRCTVFGGPMPCPAIVLEQPLPRMIDFKLTSSPSANLLQENSCIHVAYAQSIDERWVTAAWTDNRGSKQMTASYCLGRRGKPLSTSFQDIAHEMWETTHDITSMMKVHWRIIITKCGPMDQSEADFWVGLARTETKAFASLTLMTVDTSPSLQLIPPPIKVSATTNSGIYTTPVSTPAASMVSPDQSGNPPTPKGGAATATNTTNATTPGGENNATEADPDANLIDVTDITWGCLASHRLGNSTSLTELNTALVSGYLVKRGGTRPEDPPVVMEVNIIHNEGNPRVPDVLLREMLLYFRNLSTLARARGIVDRETDVRPWHVAAAEKGVQALYRYM